MVLYSADITRVVRPVFNRGLEYDPLVVALTLTLRLDAVGASRAFFSAFDASLSTGKAAGLCPLTHLAARRCTREVASRRNVAGATWGRGSLSTLHGLKLRKSVVAKSGWSTRYLRRSNQCDGEARRDKTRREDVGPL